MPKLFTPLQLRDVELKNRLVLSPMCQYSAEDGLANDWHLVHLGSRAVGGAGLIIFEATAVCAEGRISAQDLGLWDESQIAPLKRIVDFIHAQGSVAGVQLAHAGRKASKTAPWAGDIQTDSEEGGWQTVSASPEPFNEGDTVPHELSECDIQGLIVDFRNAALRALDAGFKVVEIHAAHGYLIHQFLSPLSNKRTDEYGGSFANRIRLLLEIVNAVRDVWPHNLPLFVRISASDWVEGGWSIEDSVLLSQKLKQSRRVDLIDCSSGGIVPGVHIPAGPGYQVGFAAEIKKQANILTGAVGIITSAEAAEEVLEQAQADLVFLGREMLRDPYFPMHAARALKHDLVWPQQYERAKRAL